jgi:hypothetical protein
MLLEKFSAVLHDFERSLWRGRGYAFGKTLPPAPPADPRPDHEQCEPQWIRRALAASQTLSGGGWYVLDASMRCTTEPRSFEICGRSLVVFRSGSQLVAARDRCPHLGAALSGGRVQAGRLLCPWHGMSFGPEPCPGYRPLTTYDDGRLAWVRLEDAGETPTQRPVLPERPEHGLEGVIRVEAVCDPADVIANRLDPWHGGHYHPHSFSRLRVIDQKSDEITVRVGYRVAGPFVVEVDARFHCTDPRTIVMTIARGDGEGSVVETHATPVREHRTAITELTVASSSRPGFALVRRLQPLLRPLVESAARRLWIEDAAYAERLYSLRQSVTSARDRLPVVTASAESRPSVGNGARKEPNRS